MKTYLLALALFVAPTAQAGILIEPYIGYESGKTTVETSTPAFNSVFTNTGTVLGGRFGYTFPILFWAGLDYSLTTGGKGKSDNPLVNDNTYTRSNLYLVAGFDFPILVRAWFGYGITNEASATSSGTTSKISGGQNSKLGVGFTGLPFVSINLEAFFHKPNKSDGNDLAAGESYNDAGFVLGASLPFDL